MAINFPLGIYISPNDAQEFRTLIDLAINAIANLQKRRENNNLLAPTYEELAEMYRLEIDKDIALLKILVKLQKLFLIR